MAEGEEGGLFERVAGDEGLGVSAEELEAMARAEGLVGRAVEQVDGFLAEEVAPVGGRGSGPPMLEYEGQVWALGTEKVAFGGFCGFFPWELRGFSPFLDG